LIFVRPHYFIILDRLQALAPRHYSQFFHLSPDLEARIRGTRITTFNSKGGPTIRIVPLFSDGLGLILHRGTVLPQQGWVCCGREARVPNTVVDYQLSAQSATLGVILVPEPPGNSLPVSFRAEAGVPRGETRIKIVVDQRRDEIILSPQGHVTFKPWST
jgi:hypothetical protein